MPRGIEASCLTVGGFPHEAAVFLRHCGHREAAAPTLAVDMPWEVAPRGKRREAYVENSPFFYLDRVRTPLLVICGTAEREEEMQARQTFGALRRLGKRVELRLYRDEDHDPSAWTERNLRDVAERILGWFDTFARV